MIMKIGRALHKRAKGEKGFTLIELIVVIAVLGVLATLVIPRVVGVKSDAEKAAADANEKIIRNALERYYADEGKYPTVSEGLEKLVNEDYLCEIPEISEGEYKWEYECSNPSDSYTLTKKETAGKQ